MAEKIDGKSVAQMVLNETAERVALLRENNQIPGLAVVLIGHDAASQVYVGTKVKACAQLGINSYKYELPETTTQDDVLKLIHTLNADDNIHGILVQSPPPKHIDEMKIVEAIDPRKDVDGFHVSNAGKNAVGDPTGFVPCTPAGVLELLKRYNIETSGKHTVIIGRSNIVGKPMISLMLQKGVDSTVTCCHSRTRDLPSITRQADILIAAIGKAEFVTAEMVKPGAVVIDVGINRVDDASRPRGYRIVGDVDYENVEKIATAITPVPGGVGPMTIAMLMANTVRAAEQQWA